MTRDRRLSTRDVLLVAQIAICAVLVTSSLVAVRGLARSLHAEFGVDPRHALLVDTDLRKAGFAADTIPTTQTAMVDAMKAIPGVEAVGLVGQYPPLHFGWNRTPVFEDDTSGARASNAVASPLVYDVSPDYFRAAGTQLLAGRAFTEHDDGSAPAVAIVNQELARELFGSTAGAVGRFFKTDARTRIQIVGIVQDGKYTSNLAESPQGAVFHSILQSPSSETWLVIRSTGLDPAALTSSVRAKLRELDAGLPLVIQTWSRDLNAALFAPRVAAVSLGVLGAVGGVVALTGIFGLAAHSLSKRLRELGIRIALGAQRYEVLEAALGRAFTLLTIGSIAGLILGMLASRLLGAIVYQATPRDPLVLVGAVAAMMLLGLLATWIPARRALSVDPGVLLRSE